MNSRTVIDCGTRVISNRCGSRIISIPKIALENLSQSKIKKLRIKLICEDGKSFLELSPVLELERSFN